MKDPRSLLEQALKALESCGAQAWVDGGRQWFDEKLVDDAFNDITEALGQPDQKEPSWKDHQTAKLVNDLRDCALKYRDTEQLREQIANIVGPLCDSLKQTGEEHGTS